VDSIILGWRGLASIELLEKIVGEVGLNFADHSGDDEVDLGLNECKYALSLSGAHYLVDSKDDLTSNKLSIKIAKEVSEGLEPCLSRLGKLILEQIKEGEFWLMFAYEWVSGDNVVYLEGAPEDLAVYIKLNGGAYCLLHSFSTQATNIDIDTPLVWKLVEQHSVAPMSYSR